MPARGWDAGPSDADGDERESALTAAVIAPYDFDTPEVGEVLQTEYDDDRLVIPVRLVGPARINVMPTRLTRAWTLTLAASPAPAVKVLNADPRRAVVIVNNAGDFNIGLGRTQAEANDADAYVLPHRAFVGMPGPIVLHHRDELWARCHQVGGTGELGLSVESWAR